MVNSESVNELYHLETDPDELLNVADDPAYAGVLGGLRAALARLQAEVGERPYTGQGTRHPDWNTQVVQRHSGRVQPSGGPST